MVRVQGLSLGFRALGQKPENAAASSWNAHLKLRYMDGNHPAAPCLKQEPASTLNPKPWTTHTSPAPKGSDLQTPPSPNLGFTMVTYGLYKAI